jgi:hypothetical protein
MNTSRIYLASVDLRITIAMRQIASEVYDVFIMIGGEVSNMGVSC